MACKKCGSDWLTATGKDCQRCPHCDKLQRCIARKAGRWTELTEVATCKTCCKQFVNTGADVGKNKCCSVECRDASRKAWRTEYAAGYKEGKRRVSQQKKRPKPVCRRCGCSFSRRHGRNDSNMYCCKACFFAAVSAGEQQFKGRVHDSLAGFVDWAYEWTSGRPCPHPKGHDNPSYKPRQRCKVCGDECNHRNSKFCSRECCKSWRGPRKCKCGQTVERAKAYCRPYCRDCKRKAKAKYRRYLRQQIGTYRKKCRKYGGYYNANCKRKAIIERDSYVCHVCGRKCRNDSNWNHPRAATVDHHPVPISKGGDHDWHNVRCACRSCNSKKSDTWDGQLRLRIAQF